MTQCHLSPSPWSLYPYQLLSTVVIPVNTDSLSSMFRKNSVRGKTEKGVQVIIPQQSGQLSTATPVSQRSLSDGLFFGECRKGGDRISVAPFSARSQLSSSLQFLTPLLRKIEHWHTQNVQRGLQSIRASQAPPLLESMGQLKSRIGEKGLLLYDNDMSSRLPKGGRLLDSVKCFSWRSVFPFVAHECVRCFG